MNDGAIRWCLVVFGVLVLAVGGSSIANAESIQLSLRGAAQTLYPRLEKGKRKRKRRRTRRKRKPKMTAKKLLERCKKGSRSERMKCMLRVRYRRYRRAFRLAYRIYKQSGWVVGVERAHWMNDGGWRGRVRIVPQLPVRRYRFHLNYLYRTVRDYSRFFRLLKRHTKRPIRYRWRNLSIKFFRSVRRRTPSAYAWGWNIAYNARGSLMQRYTRVRGTFFHELFHLNDYRRRGKDWSVRNLETLYTTVRNRCIRGKKLRNRCLRRYTPTRTIVRKLGIYYAFHLKKGAGEYAAEMAERYYLEHRAILFKRRRLRPFKCRAKENAIAWGLMVDEFFGGVDLTRCAR